MRFTDKELIIFDLDGTLVDSVPDLALSVNYMLESLGRGTFSENIIRTWVGNGANVLVKRALSGSVVVDKSLDDALFARALEIFLDFYSKNLAVSTKLYPDVKDTLSYLESKNYTLVIVTNKPYAFVEPILERLGLSGIFSAILGGDSLDVKKPNPKPLLYMCEQFSINLAKSIMIGDSKNDIIAANDAQMDSIALTYGYNYSEDISIYSPTVIFDKFRDIKKVL